MNEVCRRQDSVRSSARAAPSVLLPAARRRRPATAATVADGRVFSNASASLAEDGLDGDVSDDGLESLPGGLSHGMLTRIRAMKTRHDEVSSLLQNGGDQASLGKELSSLAGISALCDRVSAIHAERSSLVELLEESAANGDEDSKEFADEVHEELELLGRKLEPISRKFVESLVPLLSPEDAEDLTSSDAVIDIKAGTGGDEACLFAAEILAGYQNVAKAGGGDEHGNGCKSWDVEVLSVSRTDLGGVKDASLVVSSRGGGGGGNYAMAYADDDEGDADSDGDPTSQLIAQLGPFGFFSYESGVHRVQRVPINDTKMQTSAVSVAVLPSVSDDKVAQALPTDELRIDVMRASGAGGQHVNTTESAVRVTHLPTGIVAYIQEERSQHKNKAKALKLVAARVHQLRKEKAMKDRSAARSSLMGGGDRSERIRTYNYSQDRITDHRCKTSVQGLQTWLSSGGIVSKFAPLMYSMEREERIREMEDDDPSPSSKHKKKGKRKKNS